MLRDRDERELAHACGAAERAYRARLGARSIMTRTLPGIPHEDYRLLVTAAAMRLSNNQPTTRHYASAKSIVDKSLVRRGIGIVIPSAKPGRVTR